MQVNELPDHIRHSSIFDAADLASLAKENAIPFIDPAFYDDRLKNIVQYYSINPDEMEREVQLYAKELLNSGNISQAWQVLLSCAEGH